MVIVAIASIIRRIFFESRIIFTVFSFFMVTIFHRNIIKAKEIYDK